MNTILSLHPVLSFLAELGQNNNRAWFNENRSSYEIARSAFEQFINSIIEQLRETDQLLGLTAKECIPRINRDIRFSKDKSPYKTNFGAMVAPGGWKTTRHGYYISLEPQGKSMVAGGLYNPTAEQLSRFRQAIVEDADEFKDVTRTKEFVETFGTISGERLKTAPKGYDPSHPEIALLQLKQVTVIHPFSDQQVLALDFTEQVVSTCRVMKPFLNYLSRIVD
jgi:uncharacterized protein (TIGR02453 family)